MRDLARDLYAEVAAALGPFVVLLGQDGADEADDGGAVGEDADHVGRRRISRLSRSEGLLDQIWRQTFGEATGWHPSSFEHVFHEGPMARSVVRRVVELAVSCRVDHFGDGAQNPRLTCARPSVSGRDRGGPAR
jgi:hypothetical protein